MNRKQQKLKEKNNKRYKKMTDKLISAQKDGFGDGNNLKHNS